MKSRRMAFTIPIMVIVGVISIVMLQSNHEEINQIAKLLITLGAVVVSGIISYFLFPDHEVK